MKLPTNAPQPGAPDAVSAELTVTAALAESAQAFDLTTSARAVALAELRRLLAAWREHEPGARLGEDPEELHQLRVTARRIDATLGLFKRQLPAALVRARKSTKAILRSLGAARDLDVQLSELAHYCADLSDEERAAAEPLRELLEKERERSRARMIRSLDAEPTRRWLEMLAQATAAEAAGANGADPALIVMPERVRRRFRKLRKSVRRLRPRSSMEEYHLVRRRAKQLRYATECGADVFGKPADEMLRALRRLQDKLAPIRTPAWHRAAWPPLLRTRRAACHRLRSFSWDGWQSITPAYPVIHAVRSCAPGARCAASAGKPYARGSLN